MNLWVFVAVILAFWLGLIVDSIVERRRSAVAPAREKEPIPPGKQPMCPVPGCQIRPDHSHTEALIRRIKEN